MMSQRPSIFKLKGPKLSTSPAPKEEPQKSPPLTTPSSSTSLKLKFGKKTTSQTPASQPSPDAAPSKAIKPKPARKTKPTPKKRALEEDTDVQSSDEDISHSAPTSAPKIKKIKLTTHGPSPMPTGSGPTSLRIKGKGKIPHRPRGVGYDSEASDREKDPVITESIVLRMAPGADCDYLREAVSQGNFSRQDLQICFLSGGRRAIVKVKGSGYAAILVDLPCIIEAMKSWFPKTGWIKSADICQMLMVLGPIKRDDEAVAYPLPTGKGELDEKTWQWAHGLTPPMHWVRKRRFRKRISVRTVMEVEAEVEEMLRRDEECIGEPRIEVIDQRADRGSEEGGPSEDAYGDEDDGDEDAEGDLDADGLQREGETPMETIEGTVEDEEAEHARMAELFERQMMATADETADPLTSSAGPSFESPSQIQNFSTPPSQTATPSAMDTPRTTGAVDTSSAAEDEEEEESSDADEDDGDDEEKAERAQEMQKLREEVEDLEQAIKGEQGKMAGTQNKLLRTRLADKIRGLQGDLELKVKAMGQGG